MKASLDTENYPMITGKKSLQNSSNSYSKPEKDRVFSISKGWFGHFNKETEFRRKPQVLKVRNPHLRAAPSATTVLAPEGT